MSEVAGGYQLLVPRQREEGWFFEPYEDGEVKLEEYPNTVSSPKEYLFPQTETLYQYQSGEEGLEYENRIPEQTSRVVFGARPCDCAAVTRLDQVFLEEDKDPYYTVRRENTLIIGLVCPGAVAPNCFCTEVGLSPAGSEGMDLRATEVGHGLVRRKPPKPSVCRRRRSRTWLRSGISPRSIWSLRIQYGPGKPNTASAAVSVRFSVRPVTVSPSSTVDRRKRGKRSGRGTPASSRTTPWRPAASTPGRTGCRD